MMRLHWVFAGCAGMVILPLGAEEVYPPGAVPYGAAPPVYQGQAVQPPAAAPRRAGGSEGIPGTYWWYVPEQAEQQDYGYQRGMAPWQMRQGYQGYPSMPQQPYAGGSAPWASYEATDPAVGYPPSQYDGYQGDSSYGYPPTGYGAYRPTPVHGRGGDMALPPDRSATNAQGSYPAPLPQAVDRTQAGAAPIQPYGAPAATGRPPCEGYYSGYPDYPNYPLEMPVYQAMPGEPLPPVGEDFAPYPMEGWSTDGIEGVPDATPVLPGDPSTQTIDPVIDEAAASMILPQPTFTPAPTDIEEPPSGMQPEPVKSAE